MKTEGNTQICTETMLPGYLSRIRSRCPEEDGPANISATALAAALSMGGGSGPQGPGPGSDGGRPKVGYLRGESDCRH